jgi:hypothetical protein
MYILGVSVGWVLNFPAEEMAGRGVSMEKAGLRDADRIYVTNSTVSEYIGSILTCPGGTICPKPFPQSASPSASRN